MSYSRIEPTKIPLVSPTFGKKTSLHIKLRNGSFVYKLENDGNSMFKAISLCFYGTQDRHVILRDLIVNHVWKNWTHYDHLITKDTFYGININTADDYAVNMKKCGTEGGLFEMTIASNIFNIFIRLYNLVEQYVTQIGQPNSRKKEIPLLLEKDDNNKMHYDLILVDKGHWNKIRNREYNKKYRAEKKKTTAVEDKTEDDNKSSIERELIKNYENKRLIVFDDESKAYIMKEISTRFDTLPTIQPATNRKKAAAVKQEQSGEGESKQNHPSCSSSAPSFQDVGLSFPDDDKLKKKWMQATGLLSVSKYTSICSDHFDERCFTDTASIFGFTIRKRLLPGATPKNISSLNMCKSVGVTDMKDTAYRSTTENTEGNITGDLNKNEGDDENSILPMEVNLDDETEEPRDAQFNDTELDAEDPLNIDNTPTSTTVIETVPTPKIISTATVVNDDKPNEQKATGQNIHVRQNLTENPAPLPVVPVNPVRKRMQLKRPLPVSDILDGYNAKVSIEDEYKNYIDEDKAFLMSLLPAMKELTGPQKMEFKMTVLNELKRIRYPSSTPTPQTVGNLTVLPYAFQPIPNLANISHVIPIQQRTINPTTLQQVINKNSSTTQQTCKILSSQPPPLAAIIPQTVSATSAETAKQKQSPTVSSTATTAATVTAKPTPVEPPAKRASVSKDNNARSQPSATETKKTTSRRTPARRKPKKQAATNETQNNTEETQIITSDLTTPQDEEETRNDGELRTEIDLDEIKIEHIKVEPYDDEDTEDAMENC